MVMAPLLVLACSTTALAVPIAVVEDFSTAAQCTEEPTRSSVLLQTVNVVAKASDLTEYLREGSITCDEGSWPDKDHGLVCGECKVLVNRFNSFYKSCRGYCEANGRLCVGAWEEENDTCDVKHDMTCDDSIDSSDAICECGAEVPEPEAGICYGELKHLAVDEGTTIGTQISTRSAIECQRECSANDQCKSFSLCPEWSGCFMKDRSFTGDEATRKHADCKTYYKKQGCSAATTTTTTPEFSVTITTPEVSGPEEPTCYREMTHVAVDEGNEIGTRISTQSATACQRSCSANGQCNSFTLCPQWNSCFMKDRSFTGGEATREHGDCKTYYRTQSCTTTTTTPCVGSSCQKITVMSYNTEYKNYHARIGGYAAKIKQVAPALVGLQECQDRDGLARLSGYVANEDTSNQNYMLFDPSKVAFVSGGHMRIPRDNYAERAITWGQFKLGGITIWFFNTHLPHNHNEAASSKTHAKIARMFLEKRKQLGAENAPTIMVGDMNSHASHFNSVQGGGFESNLEANGFTWAYTARGSPGYGRIDHILYSTSHWTHSGCKDTGTGGSDHTSITCDLKLK